MVQIKKSIEKVPGGLMVVPLFFAALLNTIDQMHIPFIMSFLKSLGVAPVKPGVKPQATAPQETPSTVCLPGSKFCR